MYCCFVCTLTVETGLSVLTSVALWSLVSAIRILLMVEIRLGNSKIVVSFRSYGVREPQKTQIN